MTGSSGVCSLCVGQEWGETKEEATENIREAIEAYFESLEQDDLPIPRAC